MFQLYDVKRDEFDDMPAAPGGEETVAIDGSGDAEMFEGVEKKGELIKPGTYHFRISRILAEGASEVKNENKVALSYDNGEKMDPQPWMMVQLTCQQEPLTGRSFGVFIPWVSAKLREKAKAGDSQAKETLRRRLVEAKAMQEAAGFKPAGAYDFKRDFLGSNPEFKVQVGVRKNKQTGEDQNSAVKYFSLVAPGRV